MTITLQSLQIAGEQINVPTSALSIDVTLPNPVSEYIVSGQLSNPTTCWLSGASGNVATFSFGAPAVSGTVLTLIAFPIGLSGLNTVVLPAGTSSYSVTVPTGQSVIPICQWNTQVWFQLMGNTWTFFFSYPPGAAASFSYLIVGPGQNTIILKEPIDPNVYTASLPTANNLYLPIVSVTWNTAIGLSQTGDIATLTFTNSSPSFAATSALLVNIPINVSLFPLPQPAVVPTQQPWVVSTITPEQFAARMFALFPYPWLSDVARSTAGIAYALFLAIGTELNFIS